MRHGLAALRVDWQEGHQRQRHQSAEWGANKHRRTANGRVQDAHVTILLVQIVCNLVAATVVTHILTYGHDMWVAGMSRRLEIPLSSVLLPYPACTQRS